MKTSVKLEANSIKIFRDLYGLPKEVTNTNVVYYAIATSLPEQGRYVFAKDFNIDPDTLDQILDRRNRVTKDSVKDELTNIKKSIQAIQANEHGNESETSVEDDIQTLITLVRLLLLENYSLSNNPNDMESYLNKEVSQKLLNFAENKR
ncbi:hypothetical protein [Staphylococcus sp. Marseille-Q6910]|uniref:hypothetical protein n=1 Tax=Staphylococcus sp. Marseille-Q6910 TaxID=2937990 RepID=UPI00203DF246|nr:hypothetical protein [Staphylococcus sp. Marseille-Q6910]